jgi:hypothetical protein
VEIGCVRKEEGEGVKASGGRAGQKTSEIDRILRCESLYLPMGGQQRACVCTRERRCAPAAAHAAGRVCVVAQGGHTRREPHLLLAPALRTLRPCGTCSRARVCCCTGGAHTERAAPPARACAPHAAPLRHMQQGACVLLHRGGTHGESRTSCSRLRSARCASTRAFLSAFLRASTWSGVVWDKEMAN